MIESTELIERWSHAGDVLAAMPEHDRQHHWNMSFWGKKTKCGTVACAAGQCGLTPWFRERGFTLEFDSFGEAKISDVPGFFGLEGTTRIFYNAKLRPVETVHGEVLAYVSELEKIAALNARPDLPRIGEDWPEQGGVFAGARLGTAVDPDYYLIVGPEHEGVLGWAAGNAWAAALSIADHRDFVLPNRPEGHALWDRVRSLFQPDYYWLGTQHAEHSSDAWNQYFDSGHQDYWSKSDRRRCRAVRRLRIQ